MAVWLAAAGLGGIVVGLLLGRWHWAGGRHRLARGIDLRPGRGRQ